MRTKAQTKLKFYVVKDFTDHKFSHSLLSSQYTEGNGPVGLKKSDGNLSHSESTTVLIYFIKYKFNN